VPAPRFKGTRLEGMLKAPLRRCQGCGEAVIWAVTDNNRRMPVNATLAMKGVGNLVLWYLVDDQERPIGQQRVSSALPDYVGPLWISHFATCSKAGLFRRSQAIRGETP